MSYSEYNLWCKYRRKYGPLDPVRMYDRGHAVSSTVINNAHGGKAKLEDFLPYGKEEQKEISIAEYIKSAFGGQVKIGTRKRR